MTKSTKALLFNFLSFSVIFLVCYFLVDRFTELRGYWRPLTAAITASLLSPKFQAIRTAQGERLFVKWLFLKGLKEIR